MPLVFLENLSVYRAEEIFCPMCPGLEEHLTVWIWYMEHVLAKYLDAVIAKNNGDLNSHKTLQM